LYALNGSFVSHLTELLGFGPLECVQLGMSDAIFRDRCIWKALRESACAPPMVRDAQ